MINEVIEVLEPSTHTVENQAHTLTALALQLGYQGALTVGALEDEIRFYQQRSVEAVMELGKRLLILKDMTPHGEFTKRIEILGISKRTAQRFMSVVLKFSKTTSMSLLEKSGNGTKLLELMVLDDDDIDVINAGGSVGDVSLDSIETMSVRELKKALREANSDNEAKDQVIKNKDEKLNKQDTELSKLKNPIAIKQREESEEQMVSKRALDTVNSACLSMHNNTVRFVNEINSVYDTLDEHNVFDVQERITLAVVAAFQQIAETASELCVQVDFEEMVSPSWTVAHSTETISDTDSNNASEKDLEA